MTSSRTIAFTIPLPASVASVIECLEQAGFETWVVGGYVRDMLLHAGQYRTALDQEIKTEDKSNKPFYDLDLATAAPWQTTEKLCQKKLGLRVFETGTKHGTITVKTADQFLEITTFRKDGSYNDHRHPASVTYLSSIEEDLERRDFTINALAYHPQRGLLDLFGGIQDLKSRIIRCVGVPEIRFEEDALRILRGVRFASQLGFELEEKTEEALFACAPLLESIAAERINQELTRCLCGENILEVLMRYANIFFTVLPILRPMYNFEQHSRYHRYDVYQHTAFTVHYCPATARIRWAALLHDSGKPETFYLDEKGKGHMPHHPAASAEIVKQVAKDLRFSKQFAREVELLVLNHDVEVEPSQASIAHLYGLVDYRQDLFLDLCELKKADAKAHSELGKERYFLTQQTENLFEQLISSGAVLKPSDLSISGTDLLDIGVPKGPRIAAILDHLFEEVIHDQLEPDRQSLLKRSRELNHSMSS